MSYQSFLKTGLALIISVAVCVPAFAQQPLAIRGGKVIPVTGEPIENGVVLIRDGKIAAVGEDIDIPVEARVIDASGKVVMPGFVEAHSSEAMSQANETNPNVPYVSVLDAIDPMRPYFDSARRNGVTSVAVVPGNSTMIGGQAAVIKTGGDFVEYMVLKRDAGMKISLRPTGQNSRMGHLAALRKALDEAKRKLEMGDEEEQTDEPKKDEESEDEKQPDKDADEKDDENSNRPGPDDEQETNAELTKALVKVVSGELPVFIYCDKAMDVGHATRLVDQYKLKAILVLGRDCHKAAKHVAKSGLPVILDSGLVFWDKDPRTDEEEKIVVTELFRDQDVNFAFQVARASNNTLGTNYLWYQAATAVKYGMPKDDAMKSLTMVPAKFLSVDDFVGSLEPGKDGDVIILTGDPLKNNTWVETTIINGEIVYERDKDEKLKMLLGKTSQQ